MDSSQLSNANATRATLEGCLEVVDSYRVVKDNADSTINSLKEHNKSLEKQIDIHEEKDEANEQNTKFLEKSLKREKGKVVGGKILITIFAVSTIVLGTLYITK